MVIGALIEELIYIKNKYSGEFSMSEEDTINETCNLLEKLPRLEEATEYEPIKN